MEHTVQTVENTEVEVKKRPKNSQKTLVIILLICLILSLGGLTYFLIKDEILQIPLLTSEESNGQIVDEETEGEKEVAEEDENEDDDITEPEEDPTEDWSTYTMEDPMVSFKYPKNMTVDVDEDINTDSESGTVELMIEENDQFLKLFIFFGAGGPGSGTTGEALSPEYITTIGEFLCGDLIRMKTEEGYLYTSHIQECEECGDVDYYEPKCTCESLDNYVYPSIFTTYLRLMSVGVKETFISVQMSENTTEEYIEVYDNILLSFEAL